jgi:hypothetical protein
MFQITGTVKFYICFICYDMFHILLSWDHLWIHGMNEWKNEWMYVCMYEWMYVCMYVCMYVLDIEIGMTIYNNSCHTQQK